MPRKKKKTKGVYQFTGFDIGQIHAHMYHGLGATAISRILTKPDGKTHWTDTAIQNAMDKLTAAPTWKGVREEGSGAPRKTTEAQDKLIMKAVIDNRGVEPVTNLWLRRKFEFLRDLSHTAVADRLSDAELAYLRRRRKFRVPGKYLKDRIRYCEGVKRMRDETLLQWAYSDGTVFFLDRTDAEHEDTQRRALGCMVYRMADGSDALYHDCIGPSGYGKAQGKPVRVWGVLAAGILSICVLEEGEVMNSDLYVWTIEEYFPAWLHGCTYWVQDFERALHTDEAYEALEELGVTLVENYPACSQDFNAIENAWKLLRDRLYQTLPKEREDRAQFVSRLHDAVAWVNKFNKKELVYLSTNQKERAEDCLRGKPKGARTKW